MTRIDSRKKYVLPILIMAFAFSGCGKGEDKINVFPDDTYYYQEESASVSESAASDVAMDAVNYEALQNYTGKGIIYYKGNPYDYYKSADCAITFGQVNTSFDGDIRIVKFSVGLEMEGIYTEDDIDYSGCITPSFELVDRYSGLIFPTEPGVGNGGFAYAGNVVSQDKTISMDYTCDYQVEKTDWESDGNGGFTKKITFAIQYTVSLPNDYDGLALKVTPINRYIVSDGNQESHFVNEEYPEGTRVFEIK